MRPLLEARDVRVDIGRRRVLEAVAVEVAPGELVGVVGPNGAGKTTLLRAALGLQRLAAGEVRLGGDDPRRLTPDALARRVGYLPQERRPAWNVPALSLAALGAPGAPPAEARRIGLEALEAVGLASLAGRGVHDMSGGERSRVLLARLLATRAPLLLADEPAAGLDPDAQLMALDILRAHADRGGAVALTLHDLSLAARACDRLLVLHEGRMLAEGPPLEALSAGTLRRAFGLEGGFVDTPMGPLLAARRLQEHR